ncbi:MAG: AAA-like domain-containing protein [Byssovorax sp.]
MTTPLHFQAGGTLGEGTFYVERAADEELPAALRRGELCYVLATRQIGKSSLRLRAMRRLQAEGVVCVSIDLTSLGSANSTAADWYIGLASEIALQLDLESPDAFWDAHPGLGAVHCWSRYLEEVVLVEVKAKVVIFVDEIDSTLSLPFSRDDFFAAVRAFYNRRAEREENKELTFCLLGVAAPGDLIADPTRTPFNVGTAIRIEDFSRKEMEALRPGLEGLGDKAEVGVILDEIHGWTAGHPYLTLRVCEDLVGAHRGKPVGTIVRARFLERGRTEDANLQYADRCFGDRRGGVSGEEERTPRMLALYRRLLMKGGVAADGGDPVQLALRLTGMAAERERAMGRGGRSRCGTGCFARCSMFGGCSRGRPSGRLRCRCGGGWRVGRKGSIFCGGRSWEGAGVGGWARDLTPEEHEFLRACVRADARRPIVGMAGALWF